MEFFLFLLSILIASFFYLRLSKKISGLELELSEDLKSEIISLIAEFNQSAERNITLIEERVNIAKTVASEIANQVSYMEKLKKNLEKEIKEAEIKLNNLLVNSSSVVTKTFNKTIIAKTYEDIKNKISTNLKNENYEVKPINDVKPIELKNTSLSEKKDKNKENKIEKTEETKETKNKDIVIQMFKDSISFEEIAEKTGFTKGEIELILILENLI